MLASRKPAYIAQEVSLRLSSPEQGHRPDVYGLAAFFGRAAGSPARNSSA